MNIRKKHKAKIGKIYRDYKKYSWVVSKEFVDRIVCNINLKFANMFERLIFK